MIWRLEKQSASWHAASKVLEQKWSSRVRHLALSPNTSHILILNSGLNPTMMNLSDQLTTVLPLLNQDLIEAPISHATWHGSSPDDPVLLATTDHGDLIAAALDANCQSLLNHLKSRIARIPHLRER